VLAQLLAVWFDCVFGVVRSYYPPEKLKEIAPERKIPDLLTDLAGRNSKPSEADPEQ
jgi:hypothetical protein